MRTRSTGLACAVALLALGCPSSEPGNGAPATETGSAKQQPPAPSEPPPAPPPDTGAPPGPGPAGPAGPLPVGTPDPDDGRDQLALLETRKIRVGGVGVTAWLADTDARRQLGLMHVRELPKDHGMLFVYPDIRKRRFWMKNTLIPLSIAFIDETGKIDSIREMEPLDQSLYPSKGAVRFCLEMTRGWFADHGIGEGARVEGIVDLPGRE